jgi:subtilisin-like proprotein convertase family protein
LATRYSGVTPLVTNSTGLISAENVSIPVNNTNGITRTCVVTNNQLPEEVQVRLRLNFDVDFYDAYYGQISATVVSPRGTKSLLVAANPLSPLITNPDLGGRPWILRMDWTFTDNAFWGENPAGRWGVTVSHPYPEQEYSDTRYSWSSFEIITRSGQLVPATLVFQTQTNFGLISNRFACNLSGPAGEVVVVESSGDLVHWSAVSANTLTAKPSEPRFRPGRTGRSTRI